MAKQKIFFSYSRVDGSAFALRLAVDLKKKGFDVWIDQEDIRAGLDWDTEIENALESCDYVLFVETEKSVVSKNVLDEVYYALEQNKKVIPLIYVDSKTPYRLNRLQHIDFTGNYETGLALLLNELEGNVPTITYPSEEGRLPLAHNRPGNTKKYRALLIIAGLAVLITAAVVLIKNKSAPSAETGSKGIAAGSVNGSTGDVEPINKSAPSTETGSEGVAAGSVNGSSANVEPINKSAPPAETGSKGVAAGSVNGSSANARPIKEDPGNGPNNMDEKVAGDWRLTDVQPKAESLRGYLKIEALGENKATMKAYMQFYYPDRETPPYLTIFNSFVGCASCAVKKEMKLKVEDIAVGSTNSNKSIHGTATLQFVDNNTAVIKVKQPLSIELANGSMLEPFVYTFRFIKND